VRNGVIDIGSNSIKLVVGEKDKKELRLLESLKNIVPIGRHAFMGGEIPQETLNQSVNVLQKYRQVLRDYDIPNAKSFATTAIREAKNRDIFVDTVYRKTGFNVEILAVGDVVYYIDSYLAYTLKGSYPIHTKNVLIADLGAGSVDLSIMRKGFTLFNVGLPLGTMRLQQLLNKLDGTQEENYEAVEEYIERELSSLRRGLRVSHIDDLILIDETYSPHISTILGEETGEGRFYPFGVKEISSLLMKLKNRSAENITRDFGLPAEIADRITMYILLLVQFLKVIQKDYLFIFETSLAEAVLAELLLGSELRKKYDKTNQLVSAARYLCQKYNADLPHAQNVASMAGVIFEAAKEILGLKKDEKIYLILAAYLHDLGMFVHNRAHHKHTEYLLSALSLFRLSDKEMKIVACISRYHRGNTPSASHPLFSSLPQETRILVQKLSAILRITNALDRTHKQKVRKLDARLNERGDLILEALTHQNFVLEKVDFLEKKDLFESISGNRVHLLEKAGV